MQDIIFFSLAVLLSSFVSGVTGMGGGIILLAFMAPIFPVSAVIPLHGCIQFISNISRVILAYKKVDVKIFIMFALGAAIGAFSGLPVKISIPTNILTIFMAIAIFVFTWVPLHPKYTYFKGRFFVISAIASFLSIFVGATGPLTAPFFLNSHLNKESFVPTKSACQVPIHLFKVVVYLISGFIISKWLFYIIISAPLVFTGAYLGKLAAGRFEEQKYKLLLKLVITLLVARMLIKAFL